MANDETTVVIRRTPPVFYLVRAPMTELDPHDEIDDLPEYEPTDELDEDASL